MGERVNGCCVPQRRPSDAARTEVLLLPVGATQRGEWRSPPRYVLGARRTAFEAGSPPGSSGSQVVPAAKRPFVPRQRAREIRIADSRGCHHRDRVRCPAGGLTGRLTGIGRRTGLDGVGGPGTSMDCRPGSGRVSLARDGLLWTASPCSTRKRSQVRFLHAPPRLDRPVVAGSRAFRGFPGVWRRAPIGAVCPRSAPNRPR